MHGMSIQWIGRAALFVGIAGTIASCFMTGKFGWATSWVHALSFVTITIMAAIMFPFRAWLQKTGRRSAARTFTALACIALLGELFGDLGYTIGKREAVNKVAIHQTTGYADIGVTITETAQQEAMYVARLKSLTEANQWTGSVSADGLKAQLASANLAIEQEAARGGCKGKCLDLTKRRDDLATRISIAEEVSKLPGMIDATKAKLEKLRSQRAASPVGHSDAQSQTGFVSKLFLATTGAGTAALTPDEMTTQFVEIFIGLFIAALVCGIPTTALYMWHMITDTSQPGLQATQASPRQAPGAAPTLLSLGSGPAGLRLVARAA